MNRARIEDIEKAFKEAFGVDASVMTMEMPSPVRRKDASQVIATRVILSHISTCWKPFTAAGNNGAFGEANALMDGSSTPQVLLLGIAEEIKNNLRYNVSSRDFDKMMFDTVCEIADWDCIAEHYLQAMMTHRNANKVPRPEVEVPMMRPLQPGDTVSFPETSGVVANEKMPF